MNVVFTKAFERSLDKIKDERLKREVAESVQGLINADGVRSIRNIKKLKGHKTAYRIRVGDFRIGVFIKADNCIVAAIATRKDIYKRFP
ncbi:MAG: type II toxin-antitoxin system RelE family toxin [Flavobacteriales bacterium]